MRMDDNYIKLIKILLDKDSWTTSKELSVQLDRSLRSIKYYIAGINSMHNELIISSPKGYRINNTKAQVLLKTLDMTLPQTPEERVDYIINQLFYHRQKDGSRLDIYEIADQLYISYETVKKDLSKVREKLKRYNLTLISSDSEISILGDRINKRELLFNTFFKAAMSNFTLGDIETRLPGSNLKELQIMIQEHCRQYRYYINYYILPYFMLDIVISAFYVRTGERRQRHEKVKHRGIIEQKLVESIVEEIERHFDVTYQAEEMEELNIILSSYLIRKDYLEIDPSSIVIVVGRECINIARKIINLLRMDFSIYIEDQNLIIEFVFFLKSLLIRLENGYSIKNPLVSNIKKMSPFVFVVSTVIADKIKEIINAEINEDEIAYIAFHIGGKIEKQQFHEEVINSVIFLPQYYNSSNQLYDQLNKQYKNRIEMKLVTSPSEVVDCSRDEDLVISTMPVPDNVFIEWVSITPFLNGGDANAIDKMANKIKVKKLKSKLRKYLCQMSNPKFYSKNEYFQDKEDAIHYMTDIMEQERYIDASFFEKLITHPSSFIFEFTMIPNTFKINAEKIGLSILINEDKPLKFEDQDVECVLLFTINRAGRDICQYVFNHLVVMMQDKFKKVKLMKCDSYDEFIDTAVNCI